MSVRRTGKLHNRSDDKQEHTTMAHLFMVQIRDHRHKLFHIH